MSLLNGKKQKQEKHKLRRKNLKAVFTLYPRDVKRFCIPRLSEVVALYHLNQKSCIKIQNATPQVVRKMLRT